MSKTYEALQMALDALEATMKTMGEIPAPPFPWYENLAAITAIREALAEQPAQQTDSYVQQVPDKCDRIMWRGSYYHLPLQPVQQREPVAFLCKKENGHFDVLTDQTCKRCFPVYTSPQPAQQQEPICEVLGSRKGNDTSTVDKALKEGTKLYAAPPPAQEPVAWASMLPNEAIGIVTWSKDTAKAWASKGHIIKELSFTAPPQRKPWVGLTEEELNLVLFPFDRGSSFDDIARAIEAKLKEKNA